MALTFPSLYELKKAALFPRKLYMRHRENLEPGFMLSAMELHYYRPAFYTWCGAISENPQLLYEAELDSTSIVVDAGAYTGEWAKEIIDRYHPTIHAFEPDPRNFSHLEKKAQIEPGLKPHKYGLGDRDEQTRITLEYLGSTLYTGNRHAADTPTAEAEIRDIASAWRTLELHNVDLMKINIEGAEFPLLEQMIRTELLSKVDCYLIQFHEWHPRAYARRRHIRRALSKTHKLVWDYHFIWEKWVRK